MPNILTNPLYKPGTTYPSEGFGYNYPNDWDLRPGSTLHEKIKTEILNRARMSANSMSVRFNSWNEVDKKMNMFISTTEDEDEVKDKDPNKPISIVFPYSYAIEETLMAYMVAAFF